MPLTTVARGRVFDWSHAVGRGAARGTGFNYIQTMCLGKNGVVYTTNRGNENNFGMHANKVTARRPRRRGTARTTFSNTAKATGNLHLAVRHRGRRGAGPGLLLG